MDGFIDPPSPFDPLEEWLEFLAEMRRLPVEHSQRAAAIAQAEAEIRRRTAPEREKGRRVADWR